MLWGLYQAGLECEENSTATVCGPKQPVPPWAPWGKPISGGSKLVKTKLHKKAYIVKRCEKDKNEPNPNV